MFLNLGCRQWQIIIVTPLLSIMKTHLKKLSNLFTSGLEEAGSCLSICKVLARLKNALLGYMFGCQSLSSALQA